MTSVVFHGTMVPAGAIRNDADKPKLTLVDPAFREAMARVLAYGEATYGQGNWKEGMHYTRVLDSAARHLAAIERGEWLDADTNQPHAAHVACNMMFLNWLHSNDKRDYDDRPFLPADARLPSVPGANPAGRVHDEPSAALRLDLPEVREQGAQRGQEEDPIKALQQRIATWADRVFPDRTASDALHKLIMEEIPELLNGGLDDPHEYADVLILVLDVAFLRGIDAVQAAHGKMSINEKRRWQRDPHSGLLKHIPEDV